MNRFIWWHKLKGHRVIKFLGFTRPITFWTCQDCPENPGWAAMSTKRELQTLPKGYLK